MKTIRHQAAVMGNKVEGRLRRAKDDVFQKNGVEIRHKIYVDDAGAEYAVNWRGDLVYIVTADGGVI